MKSGDMIKINDHKGTQEVRIVGFQAGVDEMVIDDLSGDWDAVRFCDPENVVEAGR